MSAKPESRNPADENLKAKIETVYSRILNRDGEDAVKLAKKLMIAFSAGRGKQLNPVYESLQIMIKTGEIDFDPNKGVFTYKQGELTRSLDAGENASELLTDIIMLANLYHVATTGFPVVGDYVSSVLMEVANTLSTYSQSENEV